MHWVLYGPVFTWKQEPRWGQRARRVARLAFVSAKGDRKGKGTESEGINRQPPRITPLTSKAYGGVKNHIRVVRRQEAVARQSVPRARVAFRKQKKQPTKGVVKVHRDEKEVSEKHPSLGNLYGTRQKSNGPVLLVDGYNVLFPMVEQDKRRFCQLDLEEQREALEDDILLYSEFMDLRAIIVYDAMGNDTAERPFCRDQKCGMTIIFCTTLDADTGLKMEATKCLEEGASSITVVTSDRAVKVDCFHPPKIFVVSSELLLKEIKGCKVKKERALREYNLSQYMPGKLGGIISADDHADLRKLRDQLP